MTVRTRLIITIAGISVLMAGPTIYGATQLAELRSIADQQRSSHGSAFLALGRLQAALALLDRYVRSYIAIGGDAQYIGIEQSLADARQQLNDLRLSGYTNETKIAGERLDEIDRNTREITALYGSGKHAEATAAFEQTKQLFDEENAALDTIADAIEARGRADLEAAGQISGRAQVTTVFALLAALAAVFTIGYWTNRTITTPVRRLRHSMASVAAGNYILPDDLPYDRQDEIGDLARSFSWMTQHLAKLDKMKAEFMSIATHEMKTPINVVTGYTELLDEGVYGELSPEQKEALQAIRDQAHGLTRLVNQLLDVSRLEAGGLQLSMHEVVLADLMDGLERTYGMLAQKKDITLTFALGSNLPRSIQADSDRLRDQVLGNLLSNALKFTPEKGHVGVRTWGDGQMLHIEVSDTGVGIAGDQLPYVFDKYFQIGHHARSKGAGLGLAIAREIVEAHGGRITVESTEEVGTTFRIELPILQHALETNEIPATIGAAHSGN